jgi:DNA polymerase III delta prime subunit
MSEKIMAVSLRPKRFSDLFGLESTIKTMRQQIATRPPQAWALTGPPGVGKTTMAQIMAVSYQCSHMTEFGEPCDACWKRYNTLSIHEVNIAKENGVEELGRIVEVASYRPGMGSTKRVIIADEFQLATKQAQSLMLTPLEKPPEHTVWIICTTDLPKILPALQRRLTKYRLPSLGITQSKAFIEFAAQRVGIKLPLDVFAEQINLANISGPAQILQALEKYAAGASVAEAVGGRDGMDVNTLAICKAMTSGQWTKVRDMLLKSEVEDARYIRASCAGWLRGFMARGSGKDLERAAVCLKELTTLTAYEDGILAVGLWPTLYFITKRYQILQ